MSNPIRMIRVGDIVKPIPGKGWDGAPEWATLTDDLSECIGLVIDEMEMEDGFYMFEVLIGTEVYWLDSIELKLLEKE